ncbi:chloride channel protein [Enterococcus xiangfangensis]|uniref:Chloride channel protein n=1 Tax=Enterococcus xiangfangensis TaxID=1296537 RepID=A0ABU3F959_9ENTE|nr:chloride channel protein [Enterococcus xiangfangensis]MBM7711068.1 H+/Cl- antiporter ClcA [Enterococcus xiangfangensis]MDT2759212.1 chloride channel protein [Enterococcus xiangfangensis]NBK07758.1 chloride channel protein [Enterococcus asini]
MNKFKLAFFGYSGLLGLVVGVIVALFLGLSELGHQLLWQILPKALGEPRLYPLIVCTIGGVAIGFFVKAFGRYPRTLQESFDEYQATQRIDYHGGKIVRNLLGSLLVLLFGASLGPEAALVAIIGGVISYVADRRKITADQRTDLLEFGIGTSLGVIFMAPLFGVGRSVEQENWQVVTESKLKKYVLYIFATFTGFIGYLITYNLFPNQEQVFAIRKLESSFTWQGLLLVIPMILLGALFGKFFLALQEKGEKLNQRIRNPLPLAIFAGIVLGILGTISPYFLFSGEHNLLSFTRQAETMNFFILLLIGFGKIAITVFCLACNWRGGTIFPMIFASIAAALAFANVLPYSPGLLVAVFAASACAVTLKQPLATACLFLLLFPVELFLWIWLAGYLGNLFLQRVPFFQEEQTIKSFKLPELAKRAKSSSTKSASETDSTRDISALRKAADRKKAAEKVQPQVAEPKKEILVRDVRKKSETTNRVETPTRETDAAPMTRMSRHRRN